MHVRPLHRLLIGLWIFALSLSTMGVSIHAVYCYCKGQVAYSLLASALPTQQEGDCCGLPTPSANASCCAPASVSCCAEKEVLAPVTEDHGPCFEQDGCMETSSVTFVLKTDLLPEHFDVKFFKYNTPYESSGVPEYLFAAPTGMASSSVSNKAPPRFPLCALSGREIGIRHQVFRC